ncbi:DUF4139 domain-containing protein [Undibacterium jejuense]|uniref:DUF4139 domain-containing protein n=1 Tax=Undibacterium jejuense TaxID=1344949 RepID=A0A923HGI7_9BURK|nr:DUF4139 domain-containing protein [Undibacterium jejuense]MBC3862600.1 DUF4139 domain-containing protein [Undibacterium jejuense]
MRKSLLTLSAVLPQLCLGQSATPSNISNVLVYPGGATVERVAKVNAGMKELVLNCLSARFDTDSLSVHADNGIQVGDISVETLDRGRAPECANTALDKRIHDLEEQRAAIASEAGAQDFVLGYLKNVGTERQASTSPMNTTIELLRKNGQDTLQRQHQAQRRIEEIDKLLTPLRAELNTQVQANPQIRKVTIRVAAQQEAELHVSYRMTQAGWTPVYRAYLNSSKGQVKLERHAQVAQSSGEDWNDVNLKLSTVQPNQANKIYPPSPWVLDIAAPPPAFIPPPEVAYRSQPQAKFTTAISNVRPEASSPAVSFDVSVFQGEYAAEFGVPGKVSLTGNGKKIGYALGSQLIDADLRVRIQPQQEAQAYLLAEATRPAGSWPAGNLQLFRDGDFIGQNQLRFGSEEKVELFFGRDNMVQVEVEPEQKEASTKGFIGSRIEKKIAHNYHITNQHKTAVKLEVVEPTPKPENEDIKVSSQFSPAPIQQSWHKQPGIISWEMKLNPGQQIKLGADYTISYPKDANVTGLR